MERGTDEDLPNNEMIYMLLKEMSTTSDAISSTLLSSDTSPKKKKGQKGRMGYAKPNTTTLLHICAWCKEIGHTIWDCKKIKWRKRTNPIRVRTYFKRRDGRAPYRCAGCLAYNDHVWRVCPEYEAYDPTTEYSKPVSGES